MALKKYKFKDLDTGKKYTIKTNSPTAAVSMLNYKAKKKVNYTFL